MPHLPYFPFYPSDFLGDPKVMAMDTIEVGAYCLLLCVAWLETPRGSVTDQLAILKRLTRLSDTEWEAHKDAILSPFEHIENRYFQARMVKESEALEAKKAAQSQGARSTNAKRWLPISNRSVTDQLAVGIPEPYPEPYPNIKKSSPNGSVEPVRTARKSIILDQSEIERLAKNPAYAKIDLVKEGYKFKAWCEANNKNKSTRRFINWINKIT